VRMTLDVFVDPSLAVLILHLNFLLLRTAGN